MPMTIEMMIHCVSETRPKPVRGGEGSWLVATLCVMGDVGGEGQEGGCSTDAACDPRKVEWRYP
jgi:hypothetical protein